LSSTGLQRGTALDLTLTGTNLTEPTGVFTSFPAKVTIPTEDKNGQDNAKLRIHLEVPADAPIGYHTIRLATTRGISNLRLFCIDDLPQLPEVTNNRDKTTPQALAIPCVVPGKLDAEKSNWFLINVKAGQRLSFDVLGRRLGGPIDPQLSIYDAKTQREIAHDNDAPGCQTDPRLSYVFKQAGAYLIEIKDVLNRGGADYFFRLRAGDFPLATATVPLAIERGKKASLAFAGPAVEGVGAVTVEAPAAFHVSTLYVVPKGPAGLSGWPVPVLVSDLPEQVEQEPNHEPAKANRIPVPGGMTGRFLKSDETDYYVFAAKKGQKLLIEAQTLELGSPTLVYMVLKNAKTKAELAKTNPQATPPADQVIDFTSPEDGDYLLEVQHLNYVGGPDEVYRLTITPKQPSFELSMGLERFDLSAGGHAVLPLQLKRNNFAGPVGVRVHGHAGLTGKTTLGAGQTTGVLVLKAADDLPMGPYMITLVAEATIDKDVVSQLVNVRPVVSQQLGNLPFPPRHLYSEIAIAVRQRAPFTLTARLDQDGVVPGLPANLTLSVERDEGFDEDIVLLALTGLPPTVPAPKVPPIPKGQKAIKVKLDINAKVPVGKYFIGVSGKANQSGREFIVAALPAEVDVASQPFELSVSPAPVKLVPGGKATLKVTARRKGGYSGPIAVDVRNLPAKVTAAKGTIAMGQNEVELVITAADDAAAASKMDVVVGGAATALNNLANTSPSFTVVVEQK
jgi:hypothetical protein